MEITSDELWDVFSWGVDYGQYTMEEERAGEEFADAFQGFIIDAKFSMPSHQAPTRQLHSDKWFKVKQQGLKLFLNFEKSKLSETEKC